MRSPFLCPLPTLSAGDIDNDILDSLMLEDNYSKLHDP